MPYLREGKCVYKRKPDGKKGEKVGCSESVEKAKAYMRKLYMTDTKALSQFSMAIVNASIPDKAEKTMRIRMVNSDTSEDSFEERMSVDLFNDFVERIENESPVPEPFGVVCEDGWDAGMPYLSISHYKSGAGSNVPGDVEKVYVDGEKLKSSALLHDSPLGNAIWKSVCQDIEERNKPLEERTFENPVRISIGFLDLEHKHEIEDGEDFVFTRTGIKQTCEKCEEGINNKVYLKGQLVHLAFTRVPANPRTSVEVLRMSDEIKTKKQDAESIIGDLAEGLVGKSEVDDVLVVKAERDLEAYARSVRSSFYNKFEPPRPALWVRSVSDTSVVVSEKENLYLVGYEENNGEFTFDKRSDWKQVEIGLVPVKSEADENDWEIKFEEKSESDMEDVMDEQTTPVEEVIEESEVKEDVVTAPAEEKSKIDLAYEQFKAKLLDVQSESLTGEDAAKVLQPFMNNLAEVTKEVINPSEPVDANTLRSTIEAVVEAAIPKIASKVLQGMPQSQIEKSEIPQPRSLLLQRKTPIEQNNELTEIQKIAQKSTIGVAQQ